jgi:hypothetical protein
MFLRLYHLFDAKTLISIRKWHHTMDDSFESLYLLSILLMMWGFSFVIGMIFHSDFFMVAFFWASILIIVGMYALRYKKTHDNMNHLKKLILLSIPIWLFLVYQSYLTLKRTQMTSLERWGLIPFVIGLGFYLAIIKVQLEKKYDNSG